MRNRPFRLERWRRLFQRFIGSGAVVTSEPSSFQAVRCLLKGQVQGVGVRPAVARLAASLNLSGYVRNHAAGVEILAEGTADSLKAFAENLRAALPGAANPEELCCTTAAVARLVGFRIDRSESAGELTTPVPLDRGICGACAREATSGASRRTGYPFTSCTDCGPRYSLIRSMPYERQETAMRGFEQCDACLQEYADPADRRFHAQTNACPTCGPSVWLCDLRGQAIGRGSRGIELAAESLRGGRILALKGLGGYQLLCDAASDTAVLRLRARKGRGRKPLSVMLDCLPGTDAAADDPLSSLDESARSLLLNPANPIVVVPASAVSGIAPAVNPGLDTLGIFSPTTPLHLLLSRAAGKPLVVTSGNREGEPLVCESGEAEAELRDVADLFLHHDRPITHPVDDSVVRIMDGRPVTLRGGRGVAPLPLDLECARPILAVGGQQKAAVALGSPLQSALGPHIGDLESVAARERFVRQTEALLRLYGIAPELIAHDLHPDYFTTDWARRSGIPTVAVQHHHAHIAAGMLEHGWLDRTVLGVAFDGAGHGPDGTIWGGEFLLCRADSFQRVGALAPFGLPGGDQAARQPWRVAFALLTQVAGAEQASLFARRFWKIEAPRVDLLAQLLAKGDQPRTTSMGRLFDAVAAIVLGISESSYEGEPAMLLEAACDRSDAGVYRLARQDADGFVEWDWRPLIEQLLSDRRLGVSAGKLAMRFHRCVAAVVAEMAAQRADCPVALSGGCFQNRLLTELLSELLSNRFMPVGFPARIPPNDGGLAAGQLAVANARIKLEKNEETRGCV